MGKATEKVTLHQLINQLINTNSINADCYQVRYAISYHDHWLNELEAEQAFALNSFKDYVRMQQIEAHFLKMFIDLYHRFTMMYYDTKLKKLEVVADSNQFILSVLDGLREVSAFIYYIEHIDTLLVSSYDQTVTLYGLANVNLTEFEEIIKNNQLHLLE